MECKGNNPNNDDWQEKYIALEKKYNQIYEDNERLRAAANANTKINNSQHGHSLPSLDEIKSISTILDLINELDDQNS